jgi:hypothetical protein
MTTRRRPNLGKSKKKAGSQTAPKERKKLTSRDLTNIWLAVTIAGTAAWYFLISSPAEQANMQLESDLRRAESRLRDNERRVSELNEQISDFNQQITEHNRALEATSYFTISHDIPPNTHLQNLINQTTELGLTVTNGIAPEQWTQQAPQFFTAEIILEATGTYDAIDATLKLLEFGRVGTHINNVTIAKIGGDPNNPTLQLTLNATSHARKAPQGATR